MRAFGNSTGRQYRDGEEIVEVHRVDGRICEVMLRESYRVV